MPEVRWDKDDHLQRFPGLSLTYVIQAQWLSLLIPCFIRYVTMELSFNFSKHLGTILTDGCRILGGWTPPDPWGANHRHLVVVSIKFILSFQAS